MEQLSEVVISPTTIQDLPKINDLILDGEKEKTPDLFWWYFENPSGSFSIFHAELDEKAVGFASTNNFRYTIGGKQRLIAMPQKVITHDVVRGKGVFKKLYFKTEKHNLENGVQGFLTFTNALSTPIFLSKFGYKEGKAPVIYFTPAQPFSSLHSEAICLGELAVQPAQQSLANGLVKDRDYLQWRYKQYKKGELIVLKISHPGHAGPIAYAFLKPVKKWGLSFYMLMDLFNPESVPLDYISRQLRAFAARKFYLGIMYLHGNLGQGLALKVNKKINFLVKGTNDQETEVLASLTYNFFFGDMDFL